MKSGLLAVAVLLAASIVAVGCSAHRNPASPPAPTSSPPLPTTAAAAPGDPWQVAGTSVQGRPIRVQTLGHGPRRVLFIGGIHGDEPEGAYTTVKLPAAFTGADLTDRVSLTILEDANPDGRAAHTRGNANGVDVNRNFPAINFDPADPSNGRTPLSQPESRAVHDTIERIHPDLVMVVHSWHDKQFINFDGPARAIADRFAAFGT